MTNRKSCPDRLVEHFGDMPKTAAVLSSAAAQANPRVDQLSKQSILAWIRKGYIPEMYALAVERVTGGIVTADEVLKEAEKARRRLAEQR